MPRDEVLGWSANGFSIHREVFSPSEVDALALVVDSMPIERSRAGARHLLTIPSIAAIACDSRLLRLAEEVLGCTPISFGATLFDKAPDSNWLVTWHQDTALPLVERREVKGWGPWSTKSGVQYAHAPVNALETVVGLRLHLDDSSIDNGPLRVLPGTHVDGVLSEARIHAAARDVAPVACTVARGGVLRLSPLLVHASSKVTSVRSRRVLHFEYAATRSFEEGLKLHAA